MIVFVRGETLSAQSARQRKIPGWIDVLRELSSVKKWACREETIEIAIPGFLSVYFFKF